MPDSSRISDIINRLDRMESKIDALQSAEDRRKGGLKVFIGMFSILGTITGIAGAYIQGMWGKV